MRGAQLPARLNENNNKFKRDTSCFLPKETNISVFFLCQVTFINFSCCQPLHVQIYSHISSDLKLHIKHLFLFCQASYIWISILEAKDSLSVEVLPLINLRIASDFTLSHMKLSILEHKIMTSSRFNLKRVMIDFLMHTKHLLQRSHGYSVSFTWDFKSQIIFVL